jgi:single-strand DNA-binding protein
MNQITVAGTLGRDAEVRYLNNGDAVCNFSVADSQGREKPTIWWNCTLYGKRGESLAQYLSKGQSVTVVGSITEREFTDKNGNHRKAMDVRVNEIALQGGRREQQEAPAPAPAQQAQVEEDGDLPF